MLTRTSTIKWGEFSPKHKRYIKNAIKCQMSVAEGAIRSGKTIDHCIIAAIYLETCPDKIHLASGSSIANAKLNIGDCNGYGLEHLFRGRCHWGKYKDNEALYIDYTKNGSKVVIFAGGGKADSYKKILGNSYGLWIATEINQHYDSDDSETSFIKVAFGRQVAAKQPKVLWDLNPSNPNHKIYSDYIDKYLNSYVGGYNYEHFTIYDNATITPERRMQIESNYDVNTVWYKRDILGQRCIAEGLIYPQFADNNEPFIYEYINDEANETSTLPEERTLKQSEIWYVRIGIDFGNNQSSHTFVATAFSYNLRKVVVVEEQKILGSLNLTPTQLDDRFEAFTQMVYSKYHKPLTCRCDSTETTLINGFKARILKRGMFYVQVKNAIKSAIINRIHLTVRLMGAHRFGVCKNCVNMIDAFNTAVWDIKNPDEREDITGTKNPVDMLDAFEYSIEEDKNNLININ